MRNIIAMAFALWVAGALLTTSIGQAHSQSSGPGLPLRIVPQIPSMQSDGTAPPQLAPAAPGNDGPRDAALPTFCRQPMTMMSYAQQKTCAKIRHNIAATAADDVLLALTATCQSMWQALLENSMSDKTYQDQGCWHRVEADNGQVYRINLGLIQDFGTGATSVVYTDEGGAYSPENLKRWYFTCEGHFQVMGDLAPGNWIYAPPHSVGRHISDVVCAGAGANRGLTDDSESAQTVQRPTATQYCVGFSPDACDRIKKVVDAYTPSEPLPNYCNPGFALVGSGLTDEQLRICYVITGFKRATQDARPPTLVVASAKPNRATPGERAIGHWSGKGNGKSNEFHVGPGPWEFRVKSSDSISGGVYRVSDRRGVYNFGYTSGEQGVQLTSAGDVYFVIKTAGSWSVTVVSLSSPAAACNGCTRPAR
jgi:hypothetical protein